MDFAMDDPSSSTHGQPSLSDLLQQSRKLNAQLGKRVDLPSIHLGLDQIEAQSRKIAQSRATHLAAAANGDGSGFGAGGEAGNGASSGESKAHYFLANGGIDASGLADTIGQANIASAFEPLQPIFDTDIDSYLRHSHEQIILSAIEEGRRETLADFHRNLAKAQSRDWEAQKVRILEELGQHHADSGADASTSHYARDDGRFSGNKSYNNRSFSSSFRPEVSLLSGVGGSGTSAGGSSRGARYLAVVERLNAHRVDKVPFAFAKALGDAVKGANASGGAEGTTSQELYDSWKALASIIGEVNLVDGEHSETAIRERQYAPAYLQIESGNNSAAWLGREGVELRKQLTKGAISYLESYFQHHVESRIASNPVKAQLGGRPTTVGKIVAFERVTFADRDGNWPDEFEVIQTEQGANPVWVTIFYLLCTGNATSALEFVAEHEEAIRSLDLSRGGAGGFFSYFKAWVGSEDRTLPKNMRGRFMTEYNSRFRGSFANESSVDAYKLALFKLIGRIDVNKPFPSVINKESEVWLWTQMSLIRESLSDGNDFASSEVGSDSLRDRLTLEDVGARIVKFGERHFDPKGARPVHYFTLLLLSGQFERAVALLFSRAQYQVDAVHFACALTYYGLLRVPSLARVSQIDILTSTVDQASGHELMFIDFARMVQKYVRLFSRNDVKGALQYIYLICLNSDCASPTGEEQTAKCHDLIRALVIETRQYFDLLGDVRNDGTKTPGLIERSLSLIRLTDSREFLTSIVGAAAAQSEANNQTRDAILLYNIAEEYDRVLDVINRQLGLTLIEPPNPASINKEAPAPDASLTTVDDLTTLAKAILDNYERQGRISQSLSRSKSHACRLLLSLKQAFGLFASGEWEKALNLTESLDLIPLRGDVVTITRKAEAFKDVDENIAKNLSEILLLLMNCISNVYQHLKSSPFGDAGRQQRLAEYRGKGRALMLFAGMLRLRIEPSTFAQLTRLDVYLH